MQSWTKREDEKTNFKIYSKVFYIDFLGLGTSTCHCSALSKEQLVVMSCTKKCFSSHNTLVKLCQEKLNFRCLKRFQRQFLADQVIKGWIIIWAIKQASGEHLNYWLCKFSKFLSRMSDTWGLRSNRQRGTSRDHTKALCNPDRAVLGCAELETRTCIQNNHWKNSVLWHRRQGKCSVA